MSTTYVSVLVIFLANFLPKLGIMIGTEELTATITTLVTIVSGLWILYRRYAKGDITIGGVKK